MSEEEFRSYRLTSLTDPSDELLDHLFAKVAEEVKKSNEAANKAFFENLHELSRKKKAEYAKRNL